MKKNTDELDEVYMLFNEYLGDQSIYSHKLTKQQIVSEMQGRVIDMLQLNLHKDDATIILLDAILGELSMGGERQSDIVLSVVYRALRRYKNVTDDVRKD